MFVPDSAKESGALAVVGDVASLPGTARKNRHCCLLHFTGARPPVKGLYVVVVVVVWQRWWWRFWLQPSNGRKLHAL